MATGPALTRITAATITGSATSSYTFTSIPSTYTDLLIVAKVKGSNTNYGSCKLTLGTGGTLNSTTSKTQIALYGNNTSAGKEIILDMTQFDLCRASGISSDQWGMHEVRLNSYANTNIHKYMICRTSLAIGTGKGVESIAGVWRNTGAVDTIKFESTATGNNFAIGSTFTLYGVKAA
jgi:hypothetical protein